jgi:dihydropteroate synthase
VRRVAEVIDQAVRERGAAVMGILNVTPDSFSDGGCFLEPSAAKGRVESLLSEGADIVDIGAESSRPGASSISAEVQIKRLGPALEQARAADALVSIDTTSPAVARWALERGAQMINDVSCLAEPELARVVAEHQADLILMHSRAAHLTMGGFSRYPEGAYRDVVEDVLSEWSEARDRAERAGLPRSSILFDPGLGFAKSARHSVELLRRLREFGRAGARVVVGPSRKSFIGAVDPAPPEGRLGGTISACLLAVARGAAVVRVHDVRAVRQALMMVQAVLNLPEPRDD